LKPELRPYQHKLVSDVRASFRLHRRVLMQACTGAGKTVIVAHIAAGAAERGRRTCILAHRRELIEQASAKLSWAGVEHGTITADQRLPIRMQTVVASVQTLARRLDHYRDAFDFLVADECHHAVAGQWQQVIDAYPSAKVLGVTATPERMDGKGLGDVFDAMTIGPPMAELIEAGYLVAPDIYMHDVREPKCRGMRWGEELKRLAIIENEGRNRQIVRLAMKHAAGGSRVLIIANRIAHIEALHSMVEAAGSPCGMAIGKTTTDERNAHLERLINGEAPIVVANVFGEGVDLPAVDVVINAEGGKDPKQAMQRMRNLTAHAGKRHAVFHDFYDRTSKHLQEHAEERLRLYRSERAFRVHFKEELRETPCSSAPCPF